MIYGEPQKSTQVSPRQRVNQIRAALNRIKPFRVDFVQEIFADDDEQMDIQESGEIIFQNDRLLKWVYQDPDYKVFLLDGDDYRFYDQDNEQLIIGKVKARSQQWVWQLLFSDELFQDARVTWNEGEKKLHIQDQQTSSNQGDVDMDVEVIVGDHWLPVNVIQRDATGARVVFIFKQYRPRVTLTPETFRLKVPENVEIIREE